MGEMNDEPSKGEDMETLFGNRWSEMWIMGFQHDTYGRSDIINGMCSFIWWESPQ